MKVGVVIAAHNPERNRLRRVLDALAIQSLSPDYWTVTLVDNASDPVVAIEPADLRINVVREPRLGLAWARLSGVENADGELIVFVDDDNLLAADFLANARDIALAHPDVGAFGGRIIPEWENGQPPAEWVTEFSDVLALRDFGDQEILEAPGSTYPETAPVGAGLAMRREALRAWLRTAHNGRVISDRRGSSLASGGDNEMVILAIRDGFSVGYFPQLVLRHVMPPGRLERDYLARLKYGIERSWVGVLDRYGLCPWEAAHPATAPVRKARAFVRQAAWSGPAAYVRWRGACGHFDGQADIWRARRAAN